MNVLHTFKWWLILYYNLELHEDAAKNLDKCMVTFSILHNG